MPKLSVIGAGTMGTGIAQVAATAGWDVVVNDTNSDILEKSSASLVKVMNRLVEKEKIDQSTADKILGMVQSLSQQQLEEWVLFLWYMLSFLIFQVLTFFVALGLFLYLVSGIPMT